MGEYIFEYDPNVLENEIPVFREPLKKLFKDKKVFVFGYGSLLYSTGWVGRGMGRHIGPEDLIECKLRGYERGPFSTFLRKNHYGMIRNKNNTTNGVMVRINSFKEWAELMSTEGIAGMFAYALYRVVDVTEHIFDVADKAFSFDDVQIHMVCNKDLKGKWPYSFPNYGYYKRVRTGVKKERTKEFVKQFFETGGISHGSEVFDRLHKQEV